MDLLSDITNEIVAEALASEPRESRAIVFAEPEGRMPGSQSIAPDASASTQRLATEGVSPNRCLPASPQQDSSTTISGLSSVTPTSSSEREARPDVNTATPVPPAFP